jgi:ankyrin repeat protein
MIIFKNCINIPNNFDCYRMRSNRDIDIENEKYLHNFLFQNVVNRNHPEVLQLLLGNGYNPNYKDTNNETPLHVAVKSRHLECLRILLKNQQCDRNLKVTITIFKFLKFVFFLYTICIYRINMEKQL